VGACEALSKDPTADAKAVKTFQSHRYLLVPACLPWEEAKQFAERLGGHLVVTETGEEHQFLYKTFVSNYDRVRPVTGIWIGASLDARGEPDQWTGWTWVTGEPFPPDKPNMFWNPAMPDQRHSRRGRHKLKAPVLFTNAWVGMDAEEWTFPFVVEWDE
jgi:hypothetical protein